MSSSPTETRGRRPSRWGSFQLLLAALLMFLLVLSAVTVWLLRYSAMQPSVRQLADPLLSVLALIDAGDGGDPAVQAVALTRRGILRASQPPRSESPLPVPFLSVLAEHLQRESGRATRIERRLDGRTWMWMQTARGDYAGIPMEALRTLVAQFALVIAVCALALALLAAWWLARRLAAPIERLAAVAARLPEPVAAADFHVGGPREISLLGDRLASAMERIDHQRRERDLLLAGLSHDLRTPLMRLLLRIDLLDGIPASEQAALGDEIRELDRRIDRFIEHARTGAEEPVLTLDLRRLIDGALDGSRARGHAWQCELASSAPIRAQAGVLARLLDNLIDNAEQHGAAPRRIAMLAQAHQDRPGWLLRVHNAIPPDPRTLGVSPHRGFGLALCGHIARTHGGELSTARNAQGYAVTLWLPAAGAPGEID
ncbi:MAG: HAMP domain-containing sensor histidine kinase [Lysobacterales bacterium]